MEQGSKTHSARKIWHDEVISAIAHLSLDPGMVAKIKKGLEFGQQVQLPSEVAFTPELLATLFASEESVRPFQQLR